MRNLDFIPAQFLNFEQYTLARFISGGYFEKHINRMRNYYRNQRDILLESIRKSPLAGQIKIKEENSGLHFLMELQTEMPDTLLEEKAGRMGLRISCLSRYYHRPEQAKQHVIVLNYSGIDREKMGEAIEILERCVNGND